MRSAIAIVLGLGVCSGAAAFGVGCGSSSNGQQGGAADSGVVGPDDAGATDDGAGDALPNIDQPHDKYPADHQPIPQMVNFGNGPIIAAPVVVTITFAGDPRRDALRVFDDYVTTSDWWKTVMTGYGVGVGAGGGYAELAAPASKSISDDDVRTALQTGVTNGSIPKPTPNTIYVFHFSKDYTIQNGGETSCQQFAGYHSNVSITPPGSNAVDAAYAIIPTCQAYPNDNTSAEFDQVTIATSHELAEAASDPAGGSYGLVGDDSWLPSFYSLGAIIENGDACSDVYDVNNESYGGDTHSYLLQRIWDNAAAKDSRHPCQPVKSGRIYFAAAVRTTKQRGVNGTQSYGYINVPRGGTTTAVVNVFSRAELPHPFLIYVGKSKLGAADPSDLTPPGNNLTITLSRDTVQNGDGVYMTITSAKTSSITTYERLVIRSVLEKDDYNDWPFIVKVTP